jgi:hypothetical protein
MYIHKTSHIHKNYDIHLLRQRTGLNHQYPAEMLLLFDHKTVEKAASLTAKVKFCIKYNSNTQHEIFPFLLQYEEVTVT